MFYVTFSSFFNVTILAGVTEVGSTATELQVVIIFAVLSIASGVVVQQLGFMRTYLKVLTGGVLVTEVEFVWLIADLMMTEARLAVVCRHLLAWLHTEVRVSGGGGDVGVVIAVLTLLTHPGVSWVCDGEVVTSTDTPCRPHHCQVPPVTVQTQVTEWSPH